MFSQLLKSFNLFDIFASYNNSFLLELLQLLNSLNLFDIFASDSNSFFPRIVAINKKF
jgi:hypothetical protein